MNTVAGIKSKFEVDARCMDCMFQSFERLMERFPLNSSDRQLFFQKYNHTIARGGGMTMPEIHRELNREFCRLSAVKDPYFAEKVKSNSITMQLYDELQMQVVKSSDPFDMALRLSIAGNIMDYGPGVEFDIHKTIRQVLESDFAINHSAELKKRIREAKRILYIGDNAGEIVFDKLFMETIRHDRITYAVRGSAVLNDVTVADADQVEIGSVATVISNGYDASSTVLDACSPEFLKVYHDADVIISKGQGNLEGLISQNDPRIFFLLMVKCDVVAELLEVSKGSFVVYNSCSMR